jgi:transcriptional regulator with GAF, ATPase, and Fis domain
VSRGDFRADLFYRLEAVCLMVPPLRERREDIPQLVEHFCRRTRADISDVTLGRMKEAFVQRAWPGNVRELRNAVERAVLLPSLSLEGSDGDAGDEWCSVRTDPVARVLPRVDAVEAAVAVDPSGQSEALFRMPFRAAKEGAIDSWEKNYLSALMRLVHGNISRAARLVQVDRSHLRDLLRRHQIPGGDNQR